MTEKNAAGGGGGEWGTGEGGMGEEGGGNLEVVGGTGEWGRGNLEEGRMGGRDGGEKGAWWANYRFFLQRKSLSRLETVDWRGQNKSWPFPADGQSEINQWNKKDAGQKPALNSLFATLLQPAT